MTVRQPRLQTSLPCSLSIAERHYSGTIVNISQGGLFAQTEARPPLGTRVQARFRLPAEDDAILVGVVAHNQRVPSVRARGFGMCIEEAPGAYFEFLEALADAPLKAVEPSVRGSIFQHAVEPLRLLANEGWVSGEELELELEARDFSYLYGRTSEAHWYPVVSLGRFLEMLLSRVCEGDLTLLAEHFYEVAKEAADSPEWQKFIAEAQPLGVKAGEFVASRAQTEAFSFSRWHFEGESLGDFRIVVNEAGAIGEAVRFAIQGVLRLVFSRLADLPVEIFSVRLGGGSILFQGRTAQ